MQEDTEGFLYPEADSRICIDCNLCEKVCPVKHASQTGDSVLQTYIGYNRNITQRLASSSGGIFTLLAEQILKQEGKVYGAAFDQNFMVHHIGIETLTELEFLQGSKYLQSRMEQSYSQVKHDLQAGKTVLFSGTACQIVGLKEFLQKEYNNLLTVDVLCHGVPSPAVWRKYLTQQEHIYHSSIRNIWFRKKNQGWKRYEVELLFDNGEIYHQTFSEDAFMQFFLKNICLRPSCHDCRFKSLERASDMTLGDSWGVENYMPDLDDNQGTSVILIHTDAGQKLFNIIASQMQYQEAETDRALPPDADSRKSVSAHPKRTVFFQKLLEIEDIYSLLPLIKLPFHRKVFRRLKKYYQNLFKK